MGRDLEALFRVEIEPDFQGKNHRPNDFAQFGRGGYDLLWSHLASGVATCERLAP